MERERTVSSVNKRPAKQEKSKRKNRLNICKTKRECRVHNSDSEFPAASVLAENASTRRKRNTIVLEDPLKLMMRRKEEDEMRKDLYKLDLSPVKCHETDTELQDLLNEVQDDVHQPEIEPSAPGRHTFLTRHLFRLFSKDKIPGEEDLSEEQLVLIENILNTKTRNRKILHHLRETWTSEQLHSFYDYMFLLVSVHDDKMIISECAVCLNETTFWYPQVDNIFKVWLNWGATIIGDVRYTAERFQSSYTEPIFMENCKQILNIVKAKAEQIMKHITEEKECLLLKNIIDGALDVKCIHSCPSEFRTCITALVNAIPDCHWNSRKVKMICQSLHTKHDVHNLCYVCAEILKARPRCEQLGYYLASLTVHKMLDLNFNEDKIMDFLENSKAFIYKLNLYQLYLMNELVFFLTKREAEINNVNLLRTMEWFQHLRRYVKKFTKQTSLDYQIVHEVIDRSVAHWRIEVINARVYNGTNNYN